MKLRMVLFILAGFFICMCGRDHLNPNIPPQPPITDFVINGKTITVGVHIQSGSNLTKDMVSFYLAPAIALIDK